MQGSCFSLFLWIWKILYLLRHGFLTRVRIIDGQNKGSLFHPLFFSFSFFFGILNEKENVM